MEKVRIRWWIETVAAVASGLLAVLTAFVPDWIEFTGWQNGVNSNFAVRGVRLTLRRWPVHYLALSYRRSREKH